MELNNNSNQLIIGSGMLFPIEITTGENGKTGWYRHTEIAHFSKVSALTTEEFAHCSIAFCELINVFLTSHYSLLNKSVVHYSLNTSLSQENVYILWCQTYENTFALTLQLIDTKENLFCPPKKA